MNIAYLHLTILETLQYHCRYNHKRSDRRTTIKTFSGLPRTVVQVIYSKTLNKEILT